MFVSKLAAAVLLLCAAYCVESTQITISPNCTQEDVECHGLSKLYTDSFKVSSNTTFVFLNGVHSMTSDIVIRNVDNLMLQFEENSQIHCVERAELVFMNITSLQIFGLTLTNCGAEINQSLAKEALSVQTQTVLKIKKGLQAAIFAVNIREFQMDHAVINGSHGYGFLGINIVGDSSIANTLINSSNANALTDYCKTPRLTPAQAAKCLGGNALFVYNDFPECPATNSDLFYTLSVFNSTLSHGLDPIGGFQDYISRGCGLGIIMSQKYYNVGVKLVNSMFTMNTARSYGSNLYIRLIITETNSSVEIRRCHVMHGRKSNDDAIVGTPYASFVFLHGLYETSLGNHKNCSKSQNDGANTVTNLSQTDKPRRQVLFIEGSEFHNNTGGAIFLASFTSQLNIRHTYTVLIRNCTISKNIALRGSALYVLDVSSERTNLLEMTVENSVIKAHTTTREVYLGIQSAVNLISSVERFTFRNCVFVDSNNTALQLYDSNVYFEGSNIFKNNTARYGGALYLTGNSIIYLRPDAHISFDSNLALEKGGAIYIAGGNELAHFFNCQIQVFDPSFMNISKLNITMEFINNTALEAGDALYGGQIDLCFALAPSQFLYFNRTLTGTFTFNSITDFSEQPPSTSCISSDAEKICFCFDNTHNCSIKYLTVSKYPGEEFKISVIGIGQRGGTVPAVVQTEGIYNELQRTGSSCTNTSYRVASLESIKKTLSNCQHCSNKFP